MICSCITLLSFGFLFGGLLDFLYSLLFFTSSVTLSSIYLHILKRKKPMLVYSYAWWQSKVGRIFRTPPNFID